MNGEIRRDKHGILVKTYPKKRTYGMQTVWWGHPDCPVPHERRDKMTREARESLLNRGNRECHYCGEPLNKKTMTVDHKEPTVLGGADHESNMVVACERCNNLKGEDRYEPFIEWLKANHKSVGIQYRRIWDGV